MITEPTKPKASNPAQIRRFDLIIAIVVSLTIGFAAARIYSTSSAVVADAFHVLYYKDATHTWKSTNWLGTPIEKCPFDLWAMQEILNETRPDVLIEMGTFKGGSAKYFASLFDLMGHGRVITVDIERYPNLPQHPRITYLLGSSTSDAVVSQIKQLIQPGERVMAVLDSDHRQAHVLQELRIYGRMVSRGQYLVVEDTNLNGHPVEPRGGDPGPWGAVHEFLKSNHDYIQDRSREKFKVTFYPGGWLKRVQ